VLTGGPVGKSQRGSNTKVRLVEFYYKEIDLGLKKEKMRKNAIIYSLLLNLFFEDDYFLYFITGFSHIQPNYSITNLHFHQF
jgi:hypothetical protein